MPGKACNVLFAKAHKKTKEIMLYIQQDGKIVF